MATTAVAQAYPGSSHTGDAALAYHWVHTNAPPNGGCGCFGLNGLGLSGSYNINSQLAIVAEFSVDHTSKALEQAQSLTLVSYMGGARYRPFAPRMDGSHQIQPFVQVLVGGAHAGGGIAGVADGTSAFASRVGGGVDIPLNYAVTVRAFQGEYYLTNFSNTAGNHQNNMLFGAGIVIRWTH
jgi:hypothetical protein